MAAFNEQLLRIVEDYRAAGEPWPATREQMAEWAVANDRYQLTRGMAVSQCAEKISRAMGLEHVKDNQGRSVRKYYAARVRENGATGHEMGRSKCRAPFHGGSCRKSKESGLGQCWQLKNDIDSYNERRCPDQPIQMDFNFNVDLEELEQLNDVA